jgi:hypothetical protein
VLFALVEDMLVWGHALVEDSSDDYAHAGAAKEDYVLSLLITMKAGADVIAGTTGGEIVFQTLKACFHLVQIMDGLPDSPRLKCVVTNVEQVRFGEV